MKRSFIWRFIITLETCIDALTLRTRDAYSTAFFGDNTVCKSLYTLPFHHITYISITVNYDTNLPHTHVHTHIRSFSAGHS